MPRMAALVPAGEPLVKEHLDTLRCGCGRDHGFTFSPQCHLDAPTFVVYDRHAGALRIECAVCHTIVVTVAVASVSDPSHVVN